MTLANGAKAAAGGGERATGPEHGHPQGGLGTLGVLGGGQLARMWAHAAQQAGWRTMVLEPDASAPAVAVCDVHVHAAYTDPQALRTLARQCVAVTTEFENVPSDSLQLLQTAGCLVSPSAAAVAVCQHRAREKAAFVAAGVPCVAHALIDSGTDLEAAQARAELFPAILKTATLGYDGKGQITVPAPSALPAAWGQLGQVPCLLEQRVALARELSVVVARGATGECVCLPVQHNTHLQGVLAVTLVPEPSAAWALAGPAPFEHEQLARMWSQQLATSLNYVGVLCVEFFVLTDGRLLANEMAPRPHNSGHHSIDSCDVSQFGLQWRAMAGWPLVPPRQHSAAVMLNLLGDVWPAGADADAGMASVGTHAAMPPPNWAAVAALPGAHLHLYGKARARPGRKMGHLTFTAAHLSAAWSNARQAAALLGLEAAVEIVAPQLGGMASGA